MTLREPLLDSSSLFITSDTGHKNDKFFRGVYRYWRKRGFTTLVISQLLDILASTFIFIVGITLVTVVNFTALAQRAQHKTCPDGSANTADIFQSDCYGNWPVKFTRLGDLSPEWYIALAGLALYALGYLLHLVRSFWDLWRMRQFYTTVLRIDAETLVRLSWETIMGPLLTACNTNAPAVANFGFYSTPGVFLTELHVVNAITRKQNFFVALVQDQILHFPGWSDRPFFPASLQMYIDRVLQSTFAIPLSPSEQVRQLKLYFRGLALGAVVLAPLLCVYRVGYILFRYAEEWRNQPHTATTRLWTPWARCFLREYCELDHVFETRLVEAHKPANDYLNLVYFMPGTALARFCVFICGGSILVLLGLAFVLDENFLMVTLTTGRTVAFWLGIFSLVLSFCRSFIPAENVVITPALTLTAVKTALAWPATNPLNSTVVDPHVAAELGHFFVSRLTLIAEEVVGLVYIPYLMAFVLPQRAPAIIDFYTDHTEQHPEMGSVCRFGLFQGAQNAKMELSRFHFQHHYPQWTESTV